MLEICILYLFTGLSLHSYYSRATIKEEDDFFLNQTKHKVPLTEKLCCVPMSDY